MKNFSLDIPRMGYFILYKSPGKDLFGRQIISAQKKYGHSEEDSQYTHVEVSGGGQWAVKVTPPKIEVTDILKTYKGRHIKIVKFKGYDGNLKRYKVAFWAASNCNLNYDWLGVIKFKIPWTFHKEKEFFCSENAAWALGKEESLNKDPHKWMPADFLNPELFEVVWEGDLPS